MEEENKSVEENVTETPIEQTPLEPPPEIPKVTGSATLPENNNGNGGLIFVFLLLVIGSGFGTWYFAFGGKDALAGKKEEPKQEEKKEEKKEEHKEEVTKKEITEDYPKEVLKYFRLFSYHTASAEDEELYKSDKVTLSDLSNKYRNRLAFANYRLSFYSTTPKERYDGFGLIDNYHYSGPNAYYLDTGKIKKQALQIFGKDYNYVPESFNSFSIDYVEMEYVSQDALYYTVPVVGDQSTFRYAVDFYKMIDKGNIIELYEYVVVYNSDFETNKTGAFKNIEDAKNFTNPIKVGVSGNNFGYGDIVIERNNKKSAYDDDLSQYKDEASQYKITLEKEDDHYIFKSCEKIK